LRRVLRSKADDDALAAVMAQAIVNKPIRHRFDSKHRGVGEEHKFMSEIGG
jgi:molybdenum cofactor biosynthesis enzyme MoaA